MKTSEILAVATFLCAGLNVTAEEIEKTYDTAQKDMGNVAEDVFRK